MQGQGIIVDIGTGDGGFVHKLAKKYPDRLVIGIDSSQKGLFKAKKGLENEMYVLASLESLPDELKGMANQVFINLPWGSLLSKILRTDERVWDSIRMVCAPGAVIDLLISLEGAITHLQNFWPTDFEKVELQKLTNKDVRDYPSAWARKLAYGKPREFYYLRLKTM